MGQSVFKFKKLKNRRRNLLRNNSIWIGLYITQNQFSSTKSEKTRERIILANTLNGIEFTWASQFSSSISWKKTKERNLLRIIWLELDYTLLKIRFQVQKVKNPKENFFSKYFDWNRIYMGKSVFKFNKLKKQEREIF